jgi:hypothetical protein
MKKIVISCFVVLVFSTIVFGSFVHFPVEKRVNDNNLIVIGSLKNIKKTETNEFEISKATLVIENLIYGKFIGSNEQQLKMSDELQVEWRNSKTFSCKFGFATNDKEIWFLNVDKGGKIEFLGPNTSSSMSDLKEVEKHLRKKGVDKTAKKIELQNDIRVMSCSFGLENRSKKETSLIAALLVSIAAISLHFILYRSRFKIR